MMILRTDTAEVPAIELENLPTCGTFVPEFAVKNLGKSISETDLWPLTAQASEESYTVVNLHTGSVFLFHRTTRVIPVATKLYRT
jgi:hypothetical protein